MADKVSLGKSRHGSDWCDEERQARSGRNGKGVLRMRWVRQGREGCSGGIRLRLVRFGATYLGQAGRVWTDLKRSWAGHELACPGTAGKR